MGTIQTAILLLLCSTTVVESQPFPCPNFDTSQPDVTPGSNIDLTMRHGILPTKIQFPEVTTNSESYPKIDLVPARSPSAFIETFAWNDEACYEFLRMENTVVGSVNLFSTMSTSKTIYNSGGWFSSAYISRASSPPLFDYLALSQAHWNHSYYNNVRKDLLGEKCGAALLITNATMLGRGLVLKPSMPQCQTYSAEFVSDIFALPQTLEGNMNAYIAFCNKYGWYAPTEFNLYSFTTRVDVVLDSTVTSYNFGQAGTSDFTEKNCMDPEVGLVTVAGWDELGVLQAFAANLTAVINNFKMFYESHPVDDRALPKVETLMKKQIDTYEGVPAYCGGTAAPTQAPTSAATSSTSHWALLPVTLFAGVIIQGLLCLFEMK
uniref:Uncharacterized protein n=1 Tax=Pseudictyota dubia TaxID=2749911 RepID=A0A7R9VIK6_9STRA|mmetsp:Transcript_14988/g.28691  ORF Transcript_14988/g.28691 Transcript_14988/m.28691 type:complete len:378 (+) Transcript_14988:174-1307(+)